MVCNRKSSTAQVDSHVDRSSILGSGTFIQANVVGTTGLLVLELSCKRRVEKFLYVPPTKSTAPSRRPNPKLKFTEETRCKPEQPLQRASKCARRLVVRSYFHTFQPPSHHALLNIITAPTHFPEKTHPLFVTNLLEGKKVPLYGDGLTPR